MKLSDNDKFKIRKVWGDWEEVHTLRDELLIERLRAFDPEYVKDVEEAMKGASIWYA